MEGEEEFEVFLEVVEFVAQAVVEEDVLVVFFGVDCFDCLLVDVADLVWKEFLELNGICELWWDYAVYGDFDYLD